MGHRKWATVGYSTFRGAEKINSSPFLCGYGMRVPSDNQ
jgi:hypothetical protein